MVDGESCATVIFEVFKELITIKLEAHASDKYF